MSKKKFDFSGYATKVDLKCSDGRIIRKDAFKHNDGQKVPLVWQHTYSSPENILGHAQLENREDGVYAYCTFNETVAGTNAKELVKHGDITALSIHANELKQKGPDVLHGNIREVSLVLAGANPGAFIDNLSFQHGDGSYQTDDSEAIIYTGESLSLEELEHKAAEEEIDHKAAEDTRTLQDVFNSMTEEQQNACYAMIANAVGLDEEAASEDDVEHAAGENDKTIQEILDSMTEEQKNVCYAMIAQAMGEADDEDMSQGDDLDDNNKNIEHSNKGENEMKKNIFDKESQSKETTLSHDAMTAIFADAKRLGSLKDSALSHGITDIDFLFPDAVNLDGTPQFIKREMGWVQKVMGGVHHTPFSRIKSTFADITEDDARAKGYIKGNLKKEEVFSLLKRSTTPTTIYKKQKLDRDDVIDITDFDVVA